MIENGRKAFSKAGIKKTSIEDITKSVGIAKGSFYAFFDSKEELYFQILTNEICKSVISYIDQNITGQVSSKQIFGKFLRDAVISMHTNPILNLMLIPEEYNLVCRKMAVSDVDHPEVDIINPLTGILSKLQKDGIIIKKDVSLLANVIKCLFLLTTHKQEVGEDIYPDVIDFFIEMITDKFTDSTD